MKIESSGIKQFVPVVITLETELEAEFMAGVFNASNSELKSITNMSSAEIESVLNRTDGYSNTSRQKLETVRGE